MLFGKTKKVLEDKEDEIKLNLSNNYKDSAYKGYLEYIQLVNDFKDKGLSLIHISEPTRH